MKKKEVINNVAGNDDLVLTEDTVTFSSTPDPNNHNRFQTYTVKKEFLNVCAEPHKKHVVDLLGEFNLPKYLHNTNGPAIVDLTHSIPENREQYWIDGKRLKEEYAKKIKLGQQFDNEMETFLTEGDKKAKEEKHV